jgi:large subunit ribosomal protein L17
VGHIAYPVRTKAKALRPFVERVITKAKQAAAKTEKKDAIHLRRLALADVRDETAITKLFNETHKEFTNRSGGYTRIYKLGAQRLSDAAELALIEFVKADDPGYKKSKGGRGKSAKKSGGKARTPKAETPRNAEDQKTEAAPAADVSAEEPAKPEAPKPEGEART